MEKVDFRKWFKRKQVEGRYPVRGVTDVGNGVEIEFETGNEVVVMKLPYETFKLITEESGLISYEKEDGSCYFIAFLEDGFLDVFEIKDVIKIKFVRG
jgi:hypothetical protein